MSDNLNEESEEGFNIDKNLPKSSLSPSREPFTINKKLVYVSIILIIIIIAFTVVMAKLINLNSQCTSNPFIYGASKIESSRGEASPMCSCRMEGGGAFWFDDENIYKDNPFTDFDTLGERIEWN